MYPVFSSEEIPLVPGLAKWIPRRSVRAPEVANSTNSIEVKKEFGVIPAADGSDISIVQHAMPSVKPTFDVPDGEFTAQLPMKGTKSPYAPDKIIKGNRSGRRSIVLKASHEKGSVDWVIGYEEDGTPIYPNEENPEFLIRLKGCGMWIQKEQFDFPGITLASLPSVHHEGVDTIEVRGTAFPPTCASEMWISPRITAMLARCGLRPLNIPLGIWFYGPMDNDPAPNIPKSCSVFKTYADRRVETNIFAGLEKWIYDRANKEVLYEAYTKINALYKERNLLSPSSLNPSYRRINKLRKANVNDHIVKVMGTLDPFTEPNFSDESLIELGFVPSPEVYKALEGLEIEGFALSDVAKLWGRLAWEAGRCTSCVHRAGYNWGTYQDHSADGIIGNCHANNLSILPAELTKLNNGGYQLITPTDFDMSFAKEQAVNIWNETAIPDEKIVTWMFSCEFGNMLANLTGYTAALSGVATAIWKRDPEPCLALDFIWCLRDICAWEYRFGYMRPNDICWEGNDLAHETALQLIKIAIGYTIETAP